MMTGESQQITRLPRNIFIYWHTGFNEANHLIQQCVKSWQQQNPGWKLILLDNETVDSQTGGIGIPERIFNALPIQKRANMIRLKLLLVHGGVWADATLFCNRPLNDWVDQAACSGAFMFDNPGPDREIANWFIAGQPGNYLIRTLYEAQCEYWTRHDFKHDSWAMRKVKPWFNRALNRKKSLTRFWLHPIATRWLKIYSYHIFHHHFYWLMKKDRKFAEIWHGRNAWPARDAALIQKLGITSPLTDQKRNAIDASPSPVFKLNHHVDNNKLTGNTVADYLFSKSA